MILAIIPADNNPKQLQKANVSTLFSDNIVVVSDDSDKFAGR